MDRIWFKNPLAVFTATGDDASGGVVVEGSQIVEIVPGGARSQRRAMIRCSTPAGTSCCPA